MKKRKTIGFLVSGIMDNFTEYMCKGIMSAAAADDDVNIVVVPVKYIDRDLTGLPDKFEYQYKTNAYNLCRENVDALIVATDCIGCLTSRENMVDFMNSLDDIPTVLIAARMEGYPGVTFDNKSGIIEGMEYLINEMGVKNFCMMGAPKDYSDAEERRVVFRDVLDKYGLRFEEKQYIETNLTNMCLEEARTLLDANPDVEAIFCINDLVAMGLYEVMKERGLMPGQDIKVLGFDNDLTGSMVSPSLSTVDADAVELGRHAYDMTMRMLRGEDVREEKLPTRFVLRDSFGGMDSTGKTSKERLLDKRLLDEYFEKIFYQYRNADAETGLKLKKSFVRMMEHVLDFAMADQVSPNDFKLVQYEVDELINEGALIYTDNDILIPYMDELQAAILAVHDDLERKSITYRHYSFILKKLIKEMSNTTIRYEEKLDGILYSMKTVVKDTLNFTYGNDHSYSTIVSNLDGMGIKNAYVYIYDKPIVHLENEEFDNPGYMRLKAALTDGGINDIPYSKQKVKLKNLFDNQFITDKKYNMVLMPLYFGDTIYGSILFDLVDIVFHNGEFLTNQFSTAARVIEILKQNNDIQKQLEENLAVMAENNIKLDRLSRNDVLTGILNRRGFYDVAQDVIKSNKQKGKDTIVSYVDMNNLKIINDRFGHDDGDYSLKVVSSVLADVIDKKGVVGRIGGDEYAFIYYGDISEEGLNVEIRKHFEEFNSRSDKPYNVSVSCGFYRIKSDSGISLEDAMASADQDLYIAKQYKDNRILKDLT